MLFSRDEIGAEGDTVTAFDMTCSVVIVVSLQETKTSSDDIGSEDNVAVRVIVIIKVASLSGLI